ncbi:filamentous hemagglutinin N-terminal domain-containing protein, partial [Verminephrobacter aporrectodeae subsp. tuberculatae]|nr:filamentous hemagglutinin N-terminal domain-containing protein [Verminephrobacter aporrectodeae subsp. tuberculatae]
MALALWLALGALPMPMAWAQIIADPAAPANQRPTVLSDGTRPLVNIQTPSAAGLSRNTYKQFDVPASGIVLNNSSSNPWLYNGVLAKTILNEVNSTDHSHSRINGAVTVNGAAAQVIVANPNGISINGGSFVNASRLTLTTGTAQVANGALTGFNMRSAGVIAIYAGGLDSSATPYTDIMSRAFQLSGRFQAQNLGITIGAQTVAYDTGLISNQDSSDPPSYYVMDSFPLGGMHANNISILVTQAGLGVRNWGIWQADGGQIAVTVDGRLENYGTWQADGGQIAVTTNGRLENRGTIAAGGGQIAVTANDRLENRGTIAAGSGQIAVTANDRLENWGTIAAGAVSLVTPKGYIKNAGSIQGTR